MTEETREITCPACAHKFTLGPDADRENITCPHCEAKIAKEEQKNEAEIAEEIAPGFRPGQRLGNYVIKSLLGAGGMAVVFLGEQLSLSRHVAIKILPEKFADNDLFVERFESEAAVLASLNHRNVVGVIDRGKSDDTYFIVMEYIEGKTLKDRLKRKRRLTAEEVIPIAVQALEGLGYAHKRGVVHRDIKPGNIMITPEGEVKIADFGLAHLAKAQGGLDVTREHQAMGTLKYMAPEQLMSARHVDGRADLYSFGICLYEMLTGKLPVGTFKTPSEIDSSLDMRWDDIILKSLKTEPEERYQRAEHFADALRELERTPRVTAKDEERAEEAAAEAASKPEKLSPTCAKCGHESPVTARECEKCGADLDDLFEKCPSCGRINRIDVEVCPKCDANLEAHRAGKLQAALALMRKAKKLASESHYRQAMIEGRKLLQYRTREYARLRTQVMGWLKKVEKRAEKYELRLYEAGRRMFAEHRFDAAMKAWEPLPSDYKDVAHMRKEIQTLRKDADQALRNGLNALRSGDAREAVNSLEKALQFWPEDQKLRKRLVDARNRLGNLTLKQSFLRDARKARAAGKLNEAIALTRRALDLDSKDESSLALMKRLKKEEEAFYDRESAKETHLLLEERHRKSRQPMSRSTVVVLTISFSAVILLALIFAVFLPARRAQHETRAKQMLREAEYLRQDGFYGKAIRLCEEIVEKYPHTTIAPRASDRAVAMRETNTAAHQACGAIDDEARKGTLEGLDAAYWQFGEVVKQPPVSLVPTYVTYAESRRDEVRQKIAQILALQAAEHETRSEWHEALADYRLAAEKYEYTDPPIGPALQTADERVSKCASLISRARECGDQNDWAQAYALCRQALDLIWTDPDANEFLATVAPKLPPPEGMVLINRGDYIIGGSEDRPQQTITVAREYYIDRTEVTHAQYHEFLKATGRRMPYNWTEEGPPPGTENVPVSNITWNDAAAYAAWAGKQLPTEELWECAARGKEGLLYPWSNEWRDGSAAIGFGSASVDAVPADQNALGIMGLVGNVAEWTSTPTVLSVKATRPTSALRLGHHEEPSISQRYIVKGSSWAGTESGRPTTVVPLSGTSTVSAKILTPDTTSPDLFISAPSSIEFVYRGVFGQPNQARVHIKKWLPEWNQWVEATFTATMGEIIGGVASIPIEGMDAQGRPLREKLDIDLNTGCTAIEQGTDWMDVRDPYGAVRRLPLERGREDRITLKTLMRTELPPQASDIQTVATLYSRMAGRADYTYLNVGFRCIRPLWEPSEPKTNAP